MSVQIDHKSNSVSWRRRGRLSPDSVGASPARNGRRRVAALVCAATLALLGVLAMGVDIELARWFDAKNCPTAIKKCLDLCEVFGHGFGVAGILLTVWVLAPRLRPKLPRIIVSTYVAGLIALSCKLLLERNRPIRTPLSSIAGVAETFGEWFPGSSAGSAWQSFPSGHAATAIGLALGLTWLLPRGKWLFAALVVLVALQRIASGYHYLSDTLWGAAIGWLIASIWLPGGWLSGYFDRLEARLAE